jgi:tryptophan-rich sensory protein
MKRFGPLTLFLLLVVGGGLAIGFLTAPGEWYAGLAKPPFNPPNWVFAPVWTVLYVLIAVAGWRTFESDRSSWTMKLWWAQLVLNFLWSPVILLLLAAILAFLVMSWRQSRVAAWLFAPYAAWVAFAAVLNGSIWLLN